MIDLEPLTRKPHTMRAVARIDPPMPVLASSITDELFNDLKAGRVPAVGRDQIEAAIDARKLGLDQFAREDLIGLVCRRIVTRASR